VADLQILLCPIIDRRENYCSNFELFGSNLTNLFNSFDCIDPRIPAETKWIGLDRFGWKVLSN